MARNETTSVNGRNTRGNYAVAEPVCSKCGGDLEPVGNRYFIMYKRAQLPQPRYEASVCTHCGWVENDDNFQALLQERINHR